MSNDSSSIEIEGYCSPQFQWNLSNSDGKSLRLLSSFSSTTKVQVYYKLVYILLSRC